MSDVDHHPASLAAFSESVKAVQVRRSSRETYARVDAAGGWFRALDHSTRQFIERQTSAFLATASADGQPYVQHRGGPPGFLHVLDDRTIAFADFEGNRQYITQGNLAENPRAQFLFIDYPTRRRLKVWGTARVIEDDAALIQSVMPAGYEAEATGVIVFTVTELDRNCPQHIPQRFDATDVATAIRERDEKIAELKAMLGLP